MGTELIVALSAIPFVFILGYLLGRKKGLNSIEALGGHCDVCSKLSSKVLLFRGQIICIACYNAILANREMKCRFCGKQAESCECV